MNPNYNAGVDVRRMIDELPEGLPRLVGEALAGHVGRRNAISRRSLVTCLGQEMIELGVAPSRVDRDLRLTIRELRTAGCPICSTGGMSGGYFLAGSLEELNEYLRIEVHSRAEDLLRQESLMREAGQRLWGGQMSLPGQVDSRTDVLIIGVQR